MKKHERYQSGFTIVELLVVIVVIAILAAISIVSYNSIRDRANDSAAKATAVQAFKKMEIAKASNGGAYPTSLADADIQNLGSKLQYLGSATAFCITATEGNKSYKVSDTAPVPTAGGCAGHGQGGVAAITNLVANPNAVTTTAYAGSGAAGSSAVISDGTAYDGTSFIRRTFSAAASGGIYYGGGASNTPIVVAGSTYTASGYVRSSVSQNVSLRIVWFDSSYATITNNNGTSTATNSSSWTRVSFTGTAPANAAYARVFFNGTTAWSVSDYQDVDAVMLTEGSSLYNFADGSSSNWVWNGTANASTSTGPSL